MKRLFFLRESEFWDYDMTMKDACWIVGEKCVRDLLMNCLKQTDILKLSYEEQYCIDN